MKVVWVFIMKQSLKKIQSRLKSDINVYRQAMSHPRTPRLARWLLWAALGYLALPFDLIPDFIPLLGMLDDAIIIPGLVYLAVKQIPEEVLIECRKKVKHENNEYSIN